MKSLQRSWSLEVDRKLQTIGDGYGQGGSYSTAPKLLNLVILVKVVYYPSEKSFERDFK